MDGNRKEEKTTVESNKKTGGDRDENETMKSNIRCMQNEIVGKNNIIT